MMPHHPSRSILLAGAFVLIIASACALRPPPTAPAQPDVNPQSAMNAPPPSTPLTAATTNGPVEGIAKSGVVAFKGIPYAAPAWDGVRRADAFGPACIQPGAAMTETSSGDVGPQSEDCLTLNVWTPNADPAARRPVMVWIHGGAFIVGASSLPFYDGTAFARRGAVVVSMNYRLGPLGFFNHPALEEVRPGGPVNFGLLDQIAALWRRP